MQNNLLEYFFYIPDKMAERIDEELDKEEIAIKEEIVSVQEERLSLSSVKSGEGTKQKKCSGIEVERKIRNFPGVRV